MSVPIFLCVENTEAPRSSLALRPLALVVQMLAAGTVVAAPSLQAAQATEQSNERSLTLEPIAINDTATAEHVGVTEGTHSYTTDAARTATPLTMSLRETPQSVSVVTQQRIQDQDLKTIFDVVNNATGVSANRYESNRAQFTARGFQLNSLMIDGVPTIFQQEWSAGEIFSSLAMYDRVEVVRGANGLMTGAGDPSASLNMVRKRAYSKDFTGSVDLSAGTWDTYGVQADVSTALNEEGTIRARLIGETNEGDTWIDMNSNKRQTLYGTMDVDLTPDTTLWFGLSHQQSNAESPMWGGLPIWYADGSRTRWSRSKTSSAEWAKRDTLYKTYFVNLDHTFANDWQAHLSYSRGERSNDSPLLFVYGFPGRNGSSGMSTLTESFKTETTQDDYSLRFNGPFSLLGRKHEVAFGYVDSHQKFDADERKVQAGADGIADFDSYKGNFPEPIWGPRTDYGYSETRQKGLYAATRLNVTDDLKVILGARESWYEKTADNIFSEVSKIDVDHELTPYAGIVYDLTDNLSTYASYTDIFLPQSVRDRRNQELEPIVGESSEIGLKGEYFDGRLNASAAIFQIKQDNLGKNTGELIDPENPALGNAYEATEGATSKGFELEVSGELATDWNASVGYTQFTAEDAKGDDVNTLYPTKLLRTFTTYRLPGAFNKLTIGGGVNWQDSIYTYLKNPAGNFEKVQQDAYALVSLMARYEISENLTAQVNADNITDEKYFDVFDAFGSMNFGAPRSVTASAKYHF